MRYGNITPERFAESAKVTINGKISFTGTMILRAHLRKMKRIPVKVFEEITPMEARDFNFVQYYNENGRTPEIFMDLKSSNAFYPPRIYLVSIW